MGILRGPASGFRALGHIRTSNPAVPASGLPVLGGIDDLDRLIDERDAECLFVAATGLSAEDMSRVAQAGRPHAVMVRVLANLPQSFTSPGWRY